MKKIILVVLLSTVFTGCITHTTYRFGNEPVQPLTPLYSSPERHTWSKGDTECVVMPNSNKTLYFYSCDSGYFLGRRTQMFTSTKELDLNQVVILEQ